LKANVIGHSSGHRVKNVPFSVGYARHDVTHFWLLVECAKVVGATSSDGFLVKAKFHYAILVLTVPRLVADLSQTCELATSELDDRPNSSSLQIVNDSHKFDAML